ncbi:MFS transporter [Phragmitibacter flavus]|uniref:MFS transporter n=1 Tax=Phragmitibacter flavus TaxID=2576071 RepID=UPI00140DDB7A|nr:MFS transporter [Phragmitibacter flavus]
MQASRKSQFFVIFLTILLSTIGFGVCIPVLPLYAEKFNATETQNGLLIGVFSLLVFFTAPLWGKLSDRYGRRPVLLFSVLGSAAGYFLMGSANTLAMLFVARIIDGASGGNVAAAQAYIADITTPEERSKAMGLIGAAFGLGFIIGPALGGILSEQISAQAPFIFVGVLCLINALLVATSLPETHTAERRKQHGPQLPLSALPKHSDAPLFFTVAVGYFLSLAAFAIMTMTFALFGEKRFDLDQTHIGYILATIGVVGVLIQGGLIRRLLPKYGEVPLARSGMLFLLIGFVLLPLVGSVTSLVIVCCLVAAGNSLVQPTLNGLASRSVDAAWQGRALGLLQSFASLGRAIGAWMGGWLLGMDRGLDHYGRTPFWVAAALMLVTLVLALKLRAPQGQTTVVEPVVI